MSQSFQKPNLLLIKELRFMVRIFAAGLDACISMIKNEGSHKIISDFGITHIPNWEQYYNQLQNSKELSGELSKLPSEVGSKEQSSANKEVINPQFTPEHYEIIRILTEKFDQMSAAAQAGKIGWDSILEAVLLNIKNQNDGTKGSFLEKFIQVRAFIIAGASMVIFNKPVNVLFNEARDGKDDSFYKLISLDKGLLTSNWGTFRIRKAILDGDWRFFDKLSLALNKKPYSKKKQIRLAAFIIFFWDWGMN